MQHKRYGFGLAAVAAALVVGACSSTTSVAPTTSPAASAAPSATSSDAAHNEADMAFVRGMIPHHQQAVEMSDVLLGKQGIDPQIVSLANQIKKAQGPEIEQMLSWLGEWGAGSTPTPSSTGMPGHSMPGHDMSGGGGMGEMPGMGGGGQGMMSDADMAALQNAQGDEAGRLFLTQMIEHHEGAITMARQEIDAGQFPATVDMARNIVSSQQEEITTMQGILDKQ